MKLLCIAIFLAAFCVRAQYVTDTYTATTNEVADGLNQTKPLTSYSVQFSPYVGGGGGNPNAVTNGQSNVYFGGITNTTSAYYNQAGIKQIDGYSLRNSSGHNTVDWSAGKLRRDNNSTSVDWENSLLYYGGYSSVDWANRHLDDSSGNPVFWWDNGAQFAAGITIDKLGYYPSITLTTNVLYLIASNGGELDFYSDPITGYWTIAEGGSGNWSINGDGSAGFANGAQISPSGVFIGNGNGLTNLSIPSFYLTNGAVFQPASAALTNLANFNGSSLTNLNATNLVGSVNLTNSYGLLPMGTVASGFTNVSGPMLISNNAARYYSYNGNALTNLDATKLTGTIPAANLPGTRIIYSAMTPYNTISSGLTYWTPMGQSQASTTAAGRAAMIVPVSGLCTNFYFREFSAGALGTGTNLVAYIFTNAPGGSATSAGISVTITGGAALNYAATNLTQGFYINAGTEMVVGISNTAGTTASSQCNLSFQQILQ